MGTRRQQKVADLIQAEISTILLRKLKDPRLGFLTITGVKMSPDLKHARVYFSTIGDEERVETALIGLRSASGVIRGHIGRTLDLKYTPALAFFFDESLAFGAHIESRLQELHIQPAEKESEDEEGGEGLDEPQEDG
jgi:ribosome-binding factor A